MTARQRRSKTGPVTTGITSVDALAGCDDPTVGDYVLAVSEYVRVSPMLTSGVSKTAQIALSAGLGRAIKTELEFRLPGANIHAGEFKVAGALRPARADVSQAHSLDGLRLAIEIKPVNLAVGRAIWNRFGDIRAFAVNIHLKFPFAIVGGVLAVPTWEWRRATAAAEVEEQEAAAEEDAGDSLVPTPREADVADEHSGDLGGDKKSTVPLIERLVKRLQRTPLRQSEADAAHLLEAVTVIVYDPDTGVLHDELPPAGYGLRFDEFIDLIAETYDVRFE